MKADDIAAILPAVFRDALDGDPTLRTLLEVMDALQRPAEARLANLWMIFNAVATEDHFTPMLARWVDLMWLYTDDTDYDFDYDLAEQALVDSGLPSGRLRELIRASHDLAQQRGTAKGLVQFLEIATGVKGFAIDNLATNEPFRLHLRVPKAAVDQSALIERIVKAEKPAHVICDLVVS
jgi:phage tail-like protein